jgi:hydroxyethylthiazole kinase-like uncharacterized protein yjeF
MHGLFSVAQVRAIEAAAAADLPPGALMERAGRAAAEHALQLLGGIAAPRVLVVAGPGNNGGDALEVAAHLAQSNVDVAVYLLHPERQYAAPEAQRALARARASSAAFIERLDHQWDLAVDGMFGIGLQRPPEQRALECIELLNGSGKPVLAIDCPSGVDVDTGAIPGLAVRASHTITFIADKPGLHTGAGREHAGRVAVDHLRVEQALYPAPFAAANSPALFARRLTRRPVDSHKGRFGDVAILGGAEGMAGAAVLSARAALFGGAGRVMAVMLARGMPYDPVQPEVMFRDAGSFDMDSTAYVAGPGLGTTPEAIRLLLQALATPAPLVLDADALNLLALSDDLRRRLRARGNAILTPHPLEAARLLQSTTAEVQANRFAAAATLAAGTGCIVVLKGAGSVIATPDGELVVNPTGNPGLATAGTGDILAGLAGSLLAQGWPCREAALGSVYMHGLAADRLVEQGIGPIGLTAGELPAAIRAIRNELSA